MTTESEIHKSWLNLTFCNFVILKQYLVMTVSMDENYFGYFDITATEPAQLQLEQYHNPDKIFGLLNIRNNAQV